MPENIIILLVEDNLNLNEINRRALQSEGYTVLSALTLCEARELLDISVPDVILLDILLPDGNGVDFCKEIRLRTAAAILFLTSVEGYSQMLRGLEAGGDDYLVKPFDINLLLAKIASILRRDKIMEDVRKPDSVLVCGPLKLDLISQRSHLRGREIFLSPKEFSLLLLLAQNEGRMLSREYIYETIWKLPLSDDSRTVWTYMSTLKRKLMLDNERDLELESIRGKGYCLNHYKK